MEEKDPDELVKKAQKKLDPSFFKAIFSDHSERLEKALNYYKEAAEIYKIKREWIKAGDCYIEIAKLKEGMKEDSTETYNDAILCYNKGEAKDGWVKVNIEEGDGWVKEEKKINPKI